MSDAVARHRVALAAKQAHAETDAAKKMNTVIDAALALNIDDDTMVSDLLTFFIGGFHTSASREHRSTVQFSRKIGHLCVKVSASLSN